MMGYNGKHVHTLNILILDAQTKMVCFRKRFPCYKDRELKDSSKHLPLFNTLQRYASTLQIGGRMAGLLINFDDDHENPTIYNIAVVNMVLC